MKDDNVKNDEITEEAEVLDGKKKYKEEKDNKKAGNRGKKDETVDLKEKIKELENQSRLDRDQLLRSVADYRNLEKRFEDEKREFVKYANRDLLLRLIPAFDTLFLAEKYVVDEGIKLTIRHLSDALAEVGVERVPTSDKIFDATTMEAVVAGEGETDKVLEELRPGFTLNGKLVRPAQVKVGKGSN